MTDERRQSNGGRSERDIVGSSSAQSAAATTTDEGNVFFPPSVRWSPWVTAVFAVVILTSFLPVGLYLYYGLVHRNVALTVSHTGLTVDFLVGRIELPVDDIANVTYVPSPARMRRVAGAGLKGLQMGWYRLGDEGRVYRLTTVGRPVVYVDTHPEANRARPGTRYVFSPENGERLVTLLRAIGAGGDADAADSPHGQGEPTRAGLDEATITLLRGSGITFRSMASPSVLADPLLIGSIIISLPVGVVVPWVVRHARKGLRYRVGPTGIHVRHLGTRHHRWSSIKDVRRLNEPLPRVWRLMGASMPGYYAGSFTAGKLGSMNVYATRLEPPVVLIETRTGKVLISPEDVDGFMAAVAKYRPEDPT